ncbi:MAG TPA: YdeI/OmpD-associated family protein [Flavobacteriales bacterium]|nr:YdeI/OmpD-associated family protein [Flavobacteriales bacterium]HMR27420.1 YdeI/OmpD-associated family protein [Flavobacteriales bacterium]
MSAPNPKVAWFFAKQGPWQACYAQLRELALESGLTEELKWGHPCYTLKGRNVFLIHGFNAYCALLFHKGALLKDDHKLLVQQTANVQQARQIRFTGEKQIAKLAPVLRAYIRQAIALERTGKKVVLKKTAEFDMPAELANAFKQMPALKKAFQALTPGRQRGYLLFFGGAKQSATREARIEKHVDRILAGKGLND